RCGYPPQIGSAMLDLLGSAYSAWNQGSTDKARDKRVCQNDESKKNFITALTHFLGFSGTTLDQALPRANSADGNSLIERQAIQALVKEMRILAGLSREDIPSDQRRDTLIRALLKVLAYDYDQGISKMHD